MLLNYLLSFCRIAIGSVFVYALLGKVRDRYAFAQTITNFKLLSPRWSSLLALLFLSSELVVVVFLFIGGHLLSLAFGLALLLLAVFIAALLSVLARRIQTTCNCFGNSQKSINYADVWRNTGFALLATIGLWVAGAKGGVHATLNFTELLLVAMIAGSFVLIWTNLSDIVTLLQYHLSEGER